MNSMTQYYYKAMKTYMKIRAPFANHKKTLYNYYVGVFSNTNSQQSLFVLTCKKSLTNETIISDHIIDRSHLPGRMAEKRPM